MNDDALINTPFGAVAIAARGDQLAIELLGLAHADSVRIKKQSNNPLIMRACNQIAQYLRQPSATFSLPLTQRGTVFQQRVWQAIAAIPLGQTRTYGELARQIGSGPRAVANACGANNLPLLVPCHRVVAQNGIGGFMQGQQNGLLIKQWLLRHEGVRLDGVVCE
ncbi:MAG: methylated-DNA--[protein]-cysteine S-methyltransferase [Methylotenera sp.]